METQIVTLSLPKILFKKAENLARSRNMSLSDFLVQLLEDLVIQEDGYNQAKQHNLNMLSSGFDMCTRGQINWKREELHED